MVPLTRKCIGGSKYFSLIGILRIHREYINLVWYILLWKISHCIEGVSNQNLHFYIILHLSLSWVTIMHKKMISLNCLIWGIDCFLPPLFGNSKKHCVTEVYPIGNLDPIHFTFFFTFLSHPYTPEYDVIKFPHWGKWLLLAPILHELIQNAVSHQLILIIA